MNPVLFLFCIYCVSFLSCVCLLVLRHMEFKSFTKDLDAKLPKLRMETLDVTDAMINHVNLFRKSWEQKKLRRNQKLVEACTIQTQHMARTLIFSHEGPNHSSLGDRLKMVQYFGGGGENIAKMQTSIAQVENDWEHSPGHRANILGDFSEFASTVTRGLDGHLYWAQCFGN